MLTKHYINLTNGIEALPIIEGPMSFLRIQSTTIERKDWASLFLVDCDADFLMHMALGWECVVHDRGTNRPLSKTIYYALPLIEYVCNRRWFDLIPDQVWNKGRRGGRGCEVSTYFNSIYSNLMQNGRVKARLDYFKRYAIGPAVNLRGDCCSTSHDGDYQFYVDTLLNMYPSACPHALCE